jgi:two-component system OmpR family response regulator
MGDNTTNTDKAMNILIIEDEGDISLILNLMLKKENIEIEHVTTIAKAAAFLEQKQPDIIIMDNRLPDGLGMDYIQKIKADYAKIKIIMITGNTESADREKALKNGADVFLQKPFTKEQIQASLETIVHYKFA